MRIFDADVTGSLHVSGSSNFKGGVTVSGSQTITGSLTVDGNAKIGDQLTDIHTVTGSLNVTGSISGSLTGVLRTDYIDFNTGSVVVGGIGRVTWNDGDGTLDVGLKGGNVTLQLGQEQVVRVINNSGGQLLESNYQVVRVEGAQGNRVRVNLALADNDANSAETLGLVTETIAIGGEGFVTTSGIVRKINTTGALQGELWSEGDMLYLSPFVPGAITNIKPDAPNHMVIIGYVIRVHASVGQIFVKVNNGYEIDELHNVRINTGSLSYGDLLMRSGSIWTNSKNLSGSYQLTGSLDISGSQTINGNQIISGSITITQNISVLGTSSFVYVTSSNLNLTGPFIYTNVFEPIERFGGLVVFDSGSSNATASLLWDSQNNHWIYQNASGSMYSGGMLLSGPRNTGSLGQELGLTSTRIPKSVGGDHLDNSNIYDTGTVVKIISNSEITGSLKVTGGISGSIDYSYIQNVPSLVSGSAQINITGTTGYSTVSSSIATALDGKWRASDGITSDDIGFNETVIIQGGANTNVTFLPGVNTFTINSSHQSVSAAASSNNSGRTYIQDILLDSFGHITGITTATETVVNTDVYTTGATFNTSDGVVTFTRNDGNTYTVDIDGRFSTTDYYVTGGTFNTGTGNLRLTRNDGVSIDTSLDGRYLTSHPAVSAASSSDNSGRTYIQDILLDQYGHITGITTATETVVNTDTYTTGGTTNSTTGLITFTKNDGGTYTTSISGYVSTQIANLVDSAPATLDTLKELATALGNDPNFATTIATAIGNKVSKSGDTMTGNLTAPAFIKSGGTSSQFLKADGSVDTNTYLTSFSETDTLATVTARGASTATPVTFNGNVTLGNSADLTFVDLAGTFPTSGKGFDWTLNNDGARIYAIQPSSDSIDFVFQLRDNATTNDRFVFHVDDYQGPAFDKYPLIIRGGTEFDLVDSALFVRGTEVITNGRVLKNVTGNISMFTNDSGYLTAHPSVTAASSSNNSGRTYIQDIFLDSFGHITGITTATETVVDTNDFINNVVLLGNTLRFTGTGGAFSGDIDLTPFTVDNNTYVTGGTFNTGNGNLRLTRNDGGTIDVSLDGRYLTAHPSVSAASSSNNSGRTYIQDILLDSFGHITGITTATETVTDTFTTGATFNTSDGVITFTNNNGGGTFTVDIDGRFLTSYSETDTLASVTARGNTTNTSITVSGLTSNNDVVISGGTLTVYESVSGATVFAVDGTNGRLFAVTDDLSNSLFSVNTISGLPVIEAFADYHIVMGRFNQNDFYLGTTGEIGMGTAPVSGYKLAVVGNIRATSFVKSGGTSSQFLMADGSVSTNPGWLTTYNNYYTTGVTFNTGDGVLTFTRNDGGTYTVDLDGRYGTSSTDYYTTGATFNTSNGIITFTRNDGGTYTVDLDGKYLDSSSYTASDVLSKLLTVDGASSGLDADLLDGQHGSYYYPASNPSGYISSYLNYYTTGGTFNTGNGNLTLTRNDGGTYTINLDGRYQAAGSYLTAESDTLATVTSRGASTSTAVSFNGGLTTTGFTNVSSAVLANSTGISPNSYSNRVVAGGIGDGGWGVTTGLGGNAGTNHNWSMGHNGSNFYFGISDGSAPELRTYLQVSPGRVITLNGYTTNGFLKTSSSDGTLTVDTTTYYPSSNPSNYATTGYVSTQIANLVNSAPSVLDTLGEIATALGNDANFATTITTAIGNKVSKSGDTMTGDLVIGNSANGASTQAFGDFTQLLFDNSHSDTNRGPNKIVMHNNGGSWIGGFGIHSDTVSYYTGGGHRWYKTTSQTASTLMMTLDSSGNLSLGGNITGSTFYGDLVGNASTVTNGVYTNGSYSNPSWITSLAGSKITGNISGNSANITAYTINQNLGTTDSPTFNNVYISGVVQHNTSSTRDKIRLYNNSEYTIGMQSAITFGGLNDWAMTFQFNDETDRGFWWGDTAHSTAQGAMALTTDGNLTVARRIRVGYGESDTSDPTVPLQVYGSGSLVFDVQGSQGQLFSVTDSLSGSLYSVNDISGLPILEVFSDDRVVMGSFGMNSLVVSGTTTTVSGSLAVSGSATVNGGTVWHSNNDGSGSGLDADTLDGYHASSFLTSYTETDTLATVTARGASTSTAVTFNGGFNDGYITYNLAQINRSSGLVELQFGGSGGVRMFGNTAYPITLASGTGAATFSSSITANSFVKSGGSSSQFLMADGSVSTNPGWLTAHPSVSAASSVNNSGRTYIQDIFLDSFGHITGITSATETVVDTNYYTTGGTFNTGNGNLTFTRNDGGTYTVNLDGRYQAAGSYLTAESDTLATVTSRGDSTTNNITIGALTVGGSLSYGSFTGASNYVTGADNILLKGNSTGVSGIFFESEKDGTNINHASDFGFIQYHAYGIGGSSGEANRLVIGVSNDGDDLLVLNPVTSNGLVVRVGAGTTEYVVYHAGNIPTWNQNTTGNAATATLASTVTINYNNDTNSTYQLLWGSGNSVYGTAGVYLNPASDYVYAVSFNASDWFRSSGNTGWYNSTHGGGIYQTESTMVRTYDGRGFWIDGGNGNTVQDATLYVTATNNNDWLAHFNMNNGSKSEYGIYVSTPSTSSYAYALSTAGVGWTFRVDGSGRVHAPIYYDVNDTNYYLNPASTSNLGIVKLNSTASGTEVFTVDGVNGRLFTITDDLSDSLFSVNTIAGVPVIEAFSDYRVIIGRYNQYDLYVNASGQVAMGTSTATANYKLTVSGSIVVTPTGAWNAATPALNIGGTGDGRLQVRHIYGKSSSNASADHLWLQYQNTGNHVQIGDSGGGNHLYVSGNIYMGGYFGGNLVATQSWVNSQGFLTSVSDVWVNTSGDVMTGQLRIDYNIATPSNYFSGLQLEVRATSGTAGIGLHRNGFSHVGIYHDSTDQLKFNMNSGTVIVPHNAGTVWGSGNLTNLNQLINGPGYITSYIDTNYYTTSASFNTSNGVITFTRNDGGTYTVDIDGKYAESSHTHDDRYYTETESDARFQPLENQRLSTSNSPTFSQVYSNNWFRNNANNTGLYNENTTQHLSSNANGYWDMSSTTTFSGIRFYTGGHVSALRGYIYANTSNEIGFLNTGGNWTLRCDNSQNVHVTTAVYAPIYYDSANSNYYLNANGFSNLGTARFNSSGSGAEVIAADGVNGRLFTITDDMTDSIFSVNTISGLPVIEAFADYKVVMGRYGQNDLHIDNAGLIGIGKVPSTYKVDINGNVMVRGGYAYYGEYGNWTGEANKIQWHSNNLYIQNTGGGEFLFRNSGGTNVVRILNSGEIIANGNISGGYIFGTYANFSSGNSENPTIGQIWTQNTSDNYLRKSTPAHFRSQLELPRVRSTTFTNVSSVSYSHGLGTQNLIVQVFDDTGDMFFPSRINVTTDTVYVEFTTNRTGRLVVVG